MINKEDIIKEIVKKAREEKYRWNIEKVIENTLLIYEKEIINEIEDWSILEMDSDIKSYDIEELKQRIKLK
jgi:hypothetical protein